MAYTKTITIDETTAIIASRIPNFSQWVRMKLYEHARTASVSVGTSHIAPEEARIWGENQNKCNPRHKKGVCKDCWGEE
jgi:hypothetical protein